MELSRLEFNVYTLESLEIEQVAYRNIDGDVLVLDRGEKPIDGFIQFDPYEDVDMTEK